MKVAIIPSLIFCQYDPHETHVYPLLGTGPDVRETPQIKLTSIAKSQPPQLPCQSLSLTTSWYFMQIASSVHGISSGNPLGSQQNHEYQKDLQLLKHTLKAASRALPLLNPCKIQLGEKSPVL
jgi:hypothetical protein